MEQTREFELVITIVNRGFADSVMDVAKQNGAHGGTVLYGRGAGIHEAEKFFGISIQPEKEIVLILVESSNKVDLMKCIGEKCGMHSEAQGIVLSLPIDSVVGI